MAVADKPLTVQDLNKRLAAKFRPPGFVFLPELANQIGYDWQLKMSLADGVAFCPWPSRGLIVHGFEYKVQRSDWLRELKNPRKAEAFAQFCHFWWIAVTETGIVREDELPENWGLMVAHGAGLKVAVKAKKMHPKTMDAEFVASLLRCISSRWLPKGELDELLKAEFEKGKAQADTREISEMLDRLEKRTVLAGNQLDQAVTRAEQKVRGVVYDLGHVREMLDRVRQGKSPWGHD